MDRTDILEKTLEARTLATDTNYFRYIFKKTEKIVCAVFYISRSGQHNNRQDDVIIKDLEATAQKVMDEILKSLSTPLERGDESVYRVAHVLIELESKLRIVSAARLLQNDLLSVFVAEIDSVLRTLRNYTASKEANPLFVEPLYKDERRRVTGDTRVRRDTSSGSVSGGTQLMGPTRRDRVIGVLKDKGQATIKDVSEVITDCSEKTLQRELNALIDDGVVLREGERRWSKYSLI